MEEKDALKGWTTYEDGRALQLEGLPLADDRNFNGALAAVLSIALATSPGGLDGIQLLPENERIDLREPNFPGLNRDVLIG